VHPDFGANRPSSPERTLPSPFRILYTPNTRTPVVERTLHALAEFAKRAPVEVIVTVVLGRHEARLRPRVERAAPAGSVIHGWTDQMPALFTQSHLLIGKAGGATVQQALASACPMLVDYVVPGQEEGNAQLLCGLGAGAMMPPPAQLAGYLDDLAAHGGELWRKLRQAACDHGDGGAAHAVANLAVELAQRAASSSD
jgi:processive 1,2-diacylglycerol beta-glucosyltransferase